VHLVFHIYVDPVRSLDKRSQFASVNSYTKIAVFFPSYFLYTFNYQFISESIV